MRSCPANFTTVCTWVLVIAWPATLAVSLTLGPQPISLHQLACSVLPLGGCLQTTEYELASYVVLQLRLPRALLALGVGTALALSGIVLQALWRNPLADAGVLGVSTAAALGAAFASASGGLAFPPWHWVPPDLRTACGAFAVAAAVLAALYGLARWRTSPDLATLLLLGIAFNAVGSGILGLYLYLATDAQLRSLTFWTLGSAAGARWITVGLLWAGIAVFAPWLMRHSRALDALLLGEHNAFYLGFDPERFKRAALLSVAALLAPAVAAAGPVAFVGLIVPHGLRLLFGPEHFQLLPRCALAGGAFVLAGDICARTLASPAEIPLSLVTASIGGPILFVLLTHTGAQEWLR
ncbi:MAG: ABC transporter permease [Candidatus Binatia bacterium]|nr:MAG: ABC transporter permease [Candidatus Binatia bacterium]